MATRHEDALMGFLGDVASFLTDGANWRGQEGIPTLFLQHLQLTVASVVFAALLAIPLGVLFGHLRRGGTVAVNVANIGRALPAFALLILAAQIVGLGKPDGLLRVVQSVPAFIAMVALAIPPMVANSYVGVSGVDDDVRQAARGMGMNGRQVLTRVELPLAMPLVWAGIRTATVAVVATATLAAYVDSGGFGRYIVDGFSVGDDAKVFAGGLLVALLAVGLELVLAAVQRRVTSPGLARRVRMAEVAAVPQPAR
ncbi:MAG TPA: ABC transporter permease [Acidimicrobiia bacterium]